MSSFESSIFLVASRFFSISNSYSFDRSMLMARSRFLCCERSFWQLATSPVGICVMRTAESVVFTCCPLAARAVGVHANFFGLDDNFDAVVNFRRNKDAGKRRVPPLGLIKRRNAHQSMHPDFANQQPIGVLSIHRKRR